MRIKYGHIDEAWEIKQLIDKINEFLKNRRYISMLYILLTMVIDFSLD
jgi:hypothetical protein